VVRQLAFFRRLHYTANMHRLFARKISAIFFLSLAASLSWAQTKTAEPLTIYGLAGPSGVGMLRLFESPPQLQNLGLSVKVEALPSADIMAARLITGDAKIGILPPNVAAKIAASAKSAAGNTNIQIAAVTGGGMLGLLCNTDSGVKSLTDLKGKTITAAGQGAVPEYVLRKILLSYGLREGSDYKLNFSLAYPEIAASLIAGRVEIALLPEPFATMARLGNNKITDLADIKAEWKKCTGGNDAAVTSTSTGITGQDDYPMTVLVVNSEFAAKNRAAISAILDAYKASIEWVCANPAEAGALSEKHRLGLRAAVVGAAIPKSAYIFRSAADGETRASLDALFKVFLEFDSSSIGGKMPPDNFYYR
jgi:NitT/TauT family transport system substrate-binding protein